MTLLRFVFSICLPGLLTTLLLAGPAYAQLTSAGNKKWTADLLGRSTFEGEAFGATVASCDFNGDGIEDLAVGSPSAPAPVAFVPQAGRVDVIYGTMDGLTATGAQGWHQGAQDEIVVEAGSGAFADAAEDGDEFGGALAGGFFNGDSFCDLAIGVPGEDIESAMDAGVVNVIYGSEEGLTADGAQLWQQESPAPIILFQRFAASGARSLEVEGTAGTSDRFGGALAVGDFNNDGFDDLAVGVEGETVDAVLMAGAVHVILGSESGLTEDGNQVWNQAILERGADPGDAFGRSLAAGDFNNDSFVDLAIGVPGEKIEDVEQAGAVQVLMGAMTGLTFVGNQVWDVRLLDGAPDSDLFGEAVAAGDFDADGFDDLAVGMSFHDAAGDVRSAGGVHVIRGSGGGLTQMGNQFWEQNLLGETGEEDDFFGETLTAGEFNNDGFDDLAISVRGEDFSGIEDAGVVHVVFGSGNGLTADGAQLWSEVELEGNPAPFDRFSGGGPEAQSLAAGDFNGDGSDDLAVGSPVDRDVEGAPIGAVNIINGAPGATTIPQISNGPDFWTLFQIFDTGPGGDYKVEFFDSQGAPLSLPFANEAGELDENRISLEGTLPPDGSATFRTLLGGAQRTPGYAVLRAGAGVVAINTVLTQEIEGRPPFQSAIPLMPALQKSVIPLSNKRPLTTTMAWVNRAAEPVEITTMFLSLQGIEGCQDTRTLDPQQHEPFLLASRLPCSAGMDGSVVIDGGSRGVAPIAFFFQDFGPFTANIPVNLNAPPRGNIVPQVTTGGNFAAEGEFVTQFHIVNLKDTSSFYGLSFFDNGGSAQDLPFADDEGEFDGEADRLAGALPGGGSVILSTFPQIDRRAGYAVLDVGAGDVIVNTTITQRVEGRPPFQASLPLRPVMSRTHFPFDNTRPFTTTYAHANPIGSEQIFTLTAYDPAGDPQCSSESSLGPNAHEAFVLASRLPCTAGSRGQVVVRTLSEGPGLASVGFIFQDFGPFTSNLPVAGR